MIKPASLLFAGAMFATVAAADAPTPPTSPEMWSSSKPTFAISVQPTDKAGIFFVSAKVTDLKTLKLLASPALSVVAGTPATIEMGADPAMMIKFVVNVDASGEKASYTTEVRRNGEVESAQSVSLALAKRV